MTGHVEMRYSESEKRVIYEPVDLPQDFRTFDFLMPWEGPEYRLPGDEKAGAPNVDIPKTTENRGDTGAGKPAEKAAKEAARKPAKEKAKSPTDSGVKEPKTIPPHSSAKDKK